MESLLVYKHKLQVVSVFKFWRFPDKKEMAHEEKKVRFSSTVNGNPLHKEFFVLSQWNSANEFKILCYFEAMYQIKKFEAKIR